MGFSKTIAKKTFEGLMSFEVFEKLLSAYFNQIASRGSMQ
jgi:hypothetical protein